MGKICDIYNPQFLICEMKLSPNLFPWAVLMTNVVKHENCHILLPVLELNKCLKTNKTSKTKPSTESNWQRNSQRKIWKEPYVGSFWEKQKTFSFFNWEKKFPISSFVLFVYLPLFANKNRILGIWLLEKAKIRHSFLLKKWADL